MPEGEKFIPLGARLSQEENEEVKKLMEKWQGSNGLKGKENEGELKRFHELRAKEQGFNTKGASELASSLVRTEGGEKLTPEESKRLNQLEENYSPVSWPGFKMR